MNETLTPAHFELAGSFGGFVFTEEGKRRMRLHRGEADCLLKVPKELRRRIVGKFRPGEPIRVAGTEEQDPVTGAVKRVVLRVLPDAGMDVPPGREVVPFAPPVVPVAVCTIRVCAKKNCWRSGGRDLWNALGRETQIRGLGDRVELRQVGCLGRCKHAPNLDLGNREYTRCSPGQAQAIIDRTAGSLSSRREVGRQS